MRRFAVSVRNYITITVDCMKMEMRNVANTDVKLTKKMVTKNGGYLPRFLLNRLIGADFALPGHPSSRKNAAEPLLLGFPCQSRYQKSLQINKLITFIYSG